MPNARILIAEDDVNLSEILKTKLSALGYEVLVAHDGEETERLIIEKKPDLSLLDIMMPKKSGLEVLESIVQRQDTKDLAAMMLSNLAQKKDIDRATALGAKEYIVKANTSLAEIVQKLDSFLKAHPPKPRQEETPAPRSSGNGAPVPSPDVTAETQKKVQKKPEPLPPPPKAKPAPPLLPPQPLQLSVSSPQPAAPLLQFAQTTLPSQPLAALPAYPIVAISPAPGLPPQYYYLVPLQFYPPPPPPPMGNNQS